MKLHLTPQALRLIATAAVAVNMMDTLTPAQFDEGQASAEIDRLMIVTKDAARPSLRAQQGQQTNNLVAAAEQFLTKMANMQDGDFAALRHEAATERLRAGLDGFGIPTAKESMQL